MIDRKIWIKVIGRNPLAYVQYSLNNKFVNIHIIVLKYKYYCKCILKKAVGNQIPQAAKLIPLGQKRGPGRPY